MVFVSILLITSVLLIIVLSSHYKWSTFFVLLVVAIGVGLASGLSGEAVIKAIKTGFGVTMEKVGLLIILGATLGILLDKSKATLVLANYILAQTGQKFGPLAIVLIGFLIGLPIFCDSGFIVLISLTLSLGDKIPNQKLALISCLGTSLYAVHCLVPPHPGITAAAGTLGVDLGKAMLLGTVLAIPATVAAYFWSLYVNKKYNNSTDKLLEVTPKPSLKSDRRTAMASVNSYLDEQQKPTIKIGFVLLPIVIPILLIAFKSILLVYPHLLPAELLKIVKFIGEPVAALLVGIALAIPLFPVFNRSQINAIFEESIEKAGPILAVIAAGGAFGEIIKTLDLGTVYGPTLVSGGFGLLIPFVLAAIFKTAQGSSTVAVISTASICLPLLPSLGLDAEWGRLLALSAMGAGSMVVSHANDAYFWVISRFGGLSVSLTLRTHTPASVLMSFVTLFSIYILKWFLNV